jgi:hypothetical protein
VFAIIGSVGTPTSVAIEEYLQNKDIPLIQPLTGTNILRNEFKDSIIHTRPSYFDELKLIFDNLKSRNMNNVIILYQNDNFGLSSINDIQYLLTSKSYINKFNILSYGGYEPSDILLDNAIKDSLKIKDVYNRDEIQNNNFLQIVEAIIIIGPYEKVIQGIRYFKPIKKNVSIYTISFAEITSVETSISNLPTEMLNNIYITQILPEQKNMQPELINKIYNEFEYYKKSKISDDYYMPIIQNKKFSNILIEGFLNGLFIHEILKNMKDVTRRTFIDELYKRKNINIYNFEYGPYLNYQSCDKNKKGDCPCNSGLRFVYLYSYIPNKKYFIEIDKNKEKLLCNRLNNK